MFQLVPDRNAPIFLMVVLFLLITALGQQPELQQLEWVNDSTAFLAGIELPHQPDHLLTETFFWTDHSKTLDRQFQRYQNRVLSPMSKWSEAELPNQLVQDSVVRYFFSGPDILHAFYLFPTASTFILCGLEPVGEIPDLSELDSDNTEQALEELRNSLGEIIKISFFRTNDMKEDLHAATFLGTTPILMVFLARSGQYIREIEFLDLNRDGTLTSLGWNGAEADAVRIEFSPRNAVKTKTLYYFSSDLSEAALPRTGLKAWLETQPRGNAYLKAASYLLHKDWFKNARQHLIAYSYQIIQDDSGIPFRHFDSNVWHADLYGTYTGPIELFEEHYQIDLEEAYLAESRPLSFATGYKWRKGESHLMRFVKQDVLFAKEKPDSKGRSIPVKSDPSDGTTSSLKD